MLEKIKFSHFKARIHMPGSLRSRPCYPDPHSTTRSAVELAVHTSAKYASRTSSRGNIFQVRGKKLFLGGIDQEALPASGGNDAIKVKHKSKNKGVRYSCV